MPNKWNRFMMNGKGLNSLSNRGFTFWASKMIEKETVSEEVLARIVVSDRLINSVETLSFDFLPEDPNRRTYDEWANEHLSDYPVDELLDLIGVSNDDHGTYQILMKIIMKGWYDSFGEYDEEMNIIEVESQKMTDDWVKGG